MLFAWLVIVWHCCLSSNFSHKDNEEARAQEASKKNKKKKADDINRSESQVATGLGESDSKEPLQTRTFANGMIIQEVEMGKPDGKKATRGKKVNNFAIWGVSKGYTHCYSNVDMLFSMTCTYFLHGYDQFYYLRLSYLMSLTMLFFLIRFLLDILAS
jgi:hypothetical protein